jgi:hypothetical protein
MVMNKVKRDGTGIPIRVYRPRLSAFIAWLLILTYFFLCGYPLFMAMKDRASTLVSDDYRSYYFVLFVALLVLLYFAYRRHYLAIYENGIVLSSPLKRVFSSWENLKSLEVAISQRGTPQHYYLLTEEDVDETVKNGQNKISLANYSRVAVSNITKADYKRLAPSGQLGTDLRHYAPHLFE